MRQQNEQPPRQPENEPDPQQPDGSGENPKKPDNFFSRGAMGWVLLASLAVLLLLLMNHDGDARKLTPGEFLNFAEQGAFVEPVIVEDTAMRGEVPRDTPGLEAPGPGSGNIRVYATISPESKERRIRQLEEAGQPIEERPGSSVLWQITLTYGPILLFVALLYFLIYRGMRGAGGGAGMLGNFGRSRHKVTTKEHSTIRLDDVAGVAEAKDEVTEIIEFLKNPKRFQRLGGHVPRGVLLAGPPGCGKTLLAKAVAGEAEVPFFSISGSDFVEMFVGVGASRVRDLFKQAKESAPCIIFLDEIDAIGRKRGSGFTSGGHDEREQTLNAILVEMDGFESSDQVIVMAATNRQDVLDPALTRPGRFDRQITVPYPDVRGRAEILKVHSEKVKMGPDVDLKKLARGTPMFSGADLAAIINEAAIAATLEDKEHVEQEDLEEARDKVRWGRAYRSRRMEEKERIATAYHEAGHAVLQLMLEHADPLHKVTIIPRGQAGGMTFSLPEDDRNTYGARFIHDTMRVLCAGRLAEKKKTGDQTSGAAMDIRMATSFARHMVLEWGMSEKLGFVDYTTADDQQQQGFVTEKAYSERTAEVVDQEVRAMIDEAYADAESMIEKHWEEVTAVAEALLKHETLVRDDVERLIRGEALTRPTVSDLLEAEAAAPPAAPGSGAEKPDDDGEGEARNQPLPSPA